MSAAAAADTIAAVATARGTAGVGIVRVSGPRAAVIAEALAGGCPPPRQAVLRSLRDAEGELLDQALLIYMPAPHSYTGDAVLEIQAHGSPVLLELLLQRTLELGARRARPGEFTERAFLAGKLDLAQAEAVADLISAGSTAAVRAAQRSLQGEFSSRCNALASGLLDLRVRIESAIDFPEEEIDFLADPELLRRAETLSEAVAALCRSAEHGRQLNDGLTVVLAGAPNVGKSSLLNRLAGADAAIVTDVPGTTRDLLREDLVLRGVPLTLVDTAGLRDSADAVEQEGVRRARAALARADHVLEISSPDAPPPPPLQGLDPAARHTRVMNKCDLDGAPAGWTGAPGESSLRLSALHGDGIETLIAHLAPGAGEGGGEFSARSRHVDALQRAAARLASAIAQLRAGAGELAAEELRLAHAAVGEITGAVSSDDLLGEIFSRYCIGK